MRAKVLSARNGLIVICPPGPMATWSFECLSNAAARSGMAIKPIDRSDVLAEEASPHIYFAQFPSASAVEAIAAGRLDAVLVLPDLRWCLAERMDTGMSLLEAIRQLTASMVANHVIGATSRSRLIFPDFDHPLELTLRHLLSSCSLPSDPNSLEICVKPSDARAPLGLVLTDIRGKSVPEVADASDYEVAFKVLGGLTAMAQGEQSASIIWPTEVFFSGDHPNVPVGRVAEVTGPSRVMVYGPYLHLPPAGYRVEVIIGFSGRIEDIPFLLELHAGETCIAQRRLNSRKSGAYRGRFEMTVIDPGTPIEVRLRNERGAIEGEVALTELAFVVQDAEEKLDQLVRDR